MRIKRTIAIFILFVLCMGWCMPVSAASLSATVTPKMLSGSGAVTLTVRAVNDSGYDMQDIVVVVNGIAYESSETVPAGGSIEMNLSDIVVSEEMLGNHLTVQFNWSENGFEASQELKVPIERAPEVALQASHKAAQTGAAKGQPVTMTYTLNNPSEFQMTGIAIYDFGKSDPIVKDIALSAGETREVLYDYKMGSQDIASKPIIQYQVNGQSKEIALGEIPLKCLNVKLEVSVDVGETQANGTPFSIRIKNAGDQQITNIAIVDERGEEVLHGTFDLKAGRDKAIDYVVKANETRDVAFRITGTDSMGQAYELTTDTYPVKPFVSENDVSLSMVARVVTPLKDGTIKVGFSIQNNSDFAFNNAVVSEKTLGEIHSIGMMPKGQHSFEAELQIGDPRELSFELQAQDPAGTLRACTAKLNAAAEAVPTIAPSATPGEQEHEGGGGNILVTVLIVLASLMLIAGVLLLVLSSYEKKNQARSKLDDVDDVRTAPRRSPRQPIADEAPHTRPVREQPSYQTRPPVQGTDAQPQPKTSVQPDERAWQNDPMGTTAPLERPQGTKYGTQQQPKTSAETDERAWKNGYEPDPMGTTAPIERPYQTRPPVQTAQVQRGTTEPASGYVPQPVDRVRQPQQPVERESSMQQSQPVQYAQTDAADRWESGYVLEPAARPNRRMQPEEDMHEGWPVQSETAAQPERRVQEQWNAQTEEFEPVEPQTAPVHRVGRQQVRRVRPLDEKRDQ